MLSTLGIKLKLSGGAELAACVVPRYRAGIVANGDALSGSGTYYLQDETDTRGLMGDCFILR